MQKVNVVAAAVNTTELVLYLVDGTTIKIPQGDPRVKKIVAHITPIVTAGGIAEVSLDEENTYTQFEEKTSGLVKFFKVAKSKLADFFKEQKEEGEQVSQQVLGQVPVPQQATAPDTAEQTKKVEKLTSAIDEIMENAKPVHSNETIDSSHTVVALVADKQIVPDVHNIKKQITNSLATGTKGLQRFMERVAAVASKRSHSAEDLMKFLRRGDLPIADDGSIIIYKVLCKNPSGKDYVDCHTKKVPQRVGSYVHMKESLVDHNRRNECSNGLHVARRAYVGRFSGDVCVIAKVNPEDVIAVPEHDANKMRVCGYHILFELSNDDFVKLKKNRPITDTEEGRILLGRALSGGHPEPIEDVEIHSQMGNDVRVTPRAKTAAPVVEIKPAVALDPDKADTTLSPEHEINPVEVERAVIEAKLSASTEAVPTAQEGAQKAPEEKKTEEPMATVPETEEEPKKVAIASVATPSPRQKIRALLDKKILNADQAQTAFAIKKAAKKSWQALGVSKAELESIEKFLDK